MLVCRMNLKSQLKKTRRLRCIAPTCSDVRLRLIAREADLRDPSLRWYR